MDTPVDKQRNSSSQSDIEEQTAVPYTPPPPPGGSSQKKFASPIVNTALVVGVIFLGGFMMYNFVGNSLTYVSGSSARITAVPTVSVTPTPTTHP